MIAWTIIFSLAGAGLVWLIPARHVHAIRLTALFSAVLGLIAGLRSAFVFSSDGDAAVQFVTRWKWIRSLGIDFYLGADGISLVLVLLTGIAAVAGILFSWKVEFRARGYYSLYLLLIAGVYGVFLSQDLFLLFVFYELAIIPKYFLIAIWGSTRREYGAMKLVLYSFFGSALVFIGMLAIVSAAGGTSFSLETLAQASFSSQFQVAIFPVVFVGFAILAGLWPFHTWAPTGHVAAPTAASMLLAGVVMKLGAYGAFRVAMVLLPEGLLYWREAIAVLALIGILYGAGVALVQSDMKFVIGYSSVSHMGFVLLGLMTLNEVGMAGAFLQMFSHGILAGLLFAVVGRMIYDRAHTRDLRELEHRDLQRWIPFAGFFFIVGGLASMGLPGFSGFMAEMHILIGTWQLSPTFAVLSGLGILVGAAYTFRTYRLAFSNEVPSGNTEILPPITVPEKLGGILLLGTSLVVGLFPGLLLQFILPGLNAPWMKNVLKGGSL